MNIIIDMEADSMKNSCRCGKCLISFREETALLFASFVNYGEDMYFDLISISDSFFVKAFVKMEF